MNTLIDSGYAWRRLLASVIISTMGGIGMWALAVAMPEPMRPPPSTAIFLMRLGFKPPSVIPLTYTRMCSNKH